MRMHCVGPTALSHLLSCQHHSKLVPSAAQHATLTAACCTMPAVKADEVKAMDSKQRLPATLTSHTVEALQATIAGFFARTPTKKCANCGAHCPVISRWIAVQAPPACPAESLKRSMHRLALASAR